MTDATSVLGKGAQTTVLSLGLLACLACSDEDAAATSPGPDQTETTTTDPAEVTCNGQSTSAEQSDMELQLLMLVNTERARGGNCGGQALAPAQALSFNPALVCAARAHSTDMATQDYFDHVSPGGQTPFERIQEAGYSFRAAGENIALGPMTPSDVMAQWMGSQGHCENILSPSFEHFGAGIADNASGTRLWTQTFASPL